MAYSIHSTYEKDASLFGRRQKKQDDEHNADDKKDINSTQKSYDSKIHVLHHRGLVEPSKLVSTEMSMNMDEVYKNLENLKNTLSISNVNKSFSRKEEEPLMLNTMSCKNKKIGRGVNLSTQFEAATLNPPGKAQSSSRFNLYQPTMMTNPREDKSNRSNIYLASPSPSYNKEFLSSKISFRSPRSIDYQMLGKDEKKQEENENVYSSDTKRSYNTKLSELNSYIDYLKGELDHAKKANNDVVALYEKIEQKANDLATENKMLTSQLENLTMNFSMSERTNAELKMNIDSIDDIYRKYENEKNVISLQLNEKHRQYEELSKKNFLIDEHCQNLKKTIQDYEEMLGNMKRTIEILSGTETGHDKEIIEIKSILQDREEIIAHQKKENDNFKSTIKKLEEEKGFLNNELKTIKSELSLKNNNILQMQEMSNKAKDDNEALVLKVNNLATIISEKDSAIENLKISYNVLNHALEDIKKENEQMKKKVTDSEIEKNKNMKNISFLETNADETSKKFESILEERNQLKAANEELNTTMKNLIEAKEKAKITFDNSLNEMKNNLIQANDLEKKYSSENKILTESLAKKVDELTKASDAMKGHDNLKKENENLSIEMASVKELNNKQSKQYEELMGKYDALKKKAEALEANPHVATLEKKLNDSQKQNTKLSAENMALKDQHSKLNTLLGDMIKKEGNLDIVFKKISAGANVIEPAKESNLLSNMTVKFNESQATPSSNTVEKPKCEISEGTKYLFRVYDKKRILRFDLENRVFQVIEFADYEAFDMNYTAEGSIFLCVMDGLFIVTGENHDVLYFYSNQKNVMNKITKFTDNHSHGALIVDEVTKSLICLSGWHNRKVQKYTNSELIKHYLQSSWPKDSDSTGKGKVLMSYLPEMNIERSESAFLIINQKIYALFGYCCPKAKYLDTVECLDLTSNSSNWEVAKYSNDTHISTFIKSHSLVKLNDQDILIVGGFDGMKESPIENFIMFEISSSTCVISMLDRKLPDILSNHCYTFQKDSQFVPFVDGNNRLHYSSIDEMDNAHILEVKSLQYDVFKFD